MSKHGTLTSLSNSSVTLNRTVVTIGQANDLFINTTTVPSIDYEDYEYPEQDIPSRKPYFPIDGTPKEVNKKVPRFETTSEGKNNKEILDLFKKNLRNESTSEPSTTSASATTLAVDTFDDRLEVVDMGYGSDVEDQGGCSCPCPGAGTHHPAGPKFFSNSFGGNLHEETEKRVPNVVMVVDGSKKNGEEKKKTKKKKNYFPVNQDDGLDQSADVDQADRPDFNEAVDLTHDPSIFFQVKTF